VEQLPGCAHCEEVIGVYEPVWLVLPDGTSRKGSLITLGCDADTPCGVLVQSAATARSSTGGAERR
jgi:hypothetical protein